MPGGLERPVGATRRSGGSGRRRGATGRCDGVTEYACDGVIEYACDGRRVSAWRGGAEEGFEKKSNKRGESAPSPPPSEREGPRWDPPDESVGFEPQGELP